MEVAESDFYIHYAAYHEIRPPGVEVKLYYTK